MLKNSFSRRSRKRALRHSQANTQTLASLQRNGLHASPINRRLTISSRALQTVPQERATRADSHQDSWVGERTALPADEHTIVRARLKQLMRDAGDMYRKVQFSMHIYAMCMENAAYLST